MNNTLTALVGVKVGHSINQNHFQGCTTIIFDNPLNVACVSRGGAAITFNTSQLSLDKNYYLRHGIFISDGGHVGLESATYINKALQENRIGWKMAGSYYPAITGAAIRSITVDEYGFNPSIGYDAVANLTNYPIKSGNTGVGLGAMVGKFSWTEKGECLAMKSGIGSSRIDLGQGAMICALTVVNALGNVVNKDGSIQAGNRNDKREPRFRTFEGFSRFLVNKGSNTTISVVGTNIKLQFIQQDLTRIAEIATHGQIRSINPINTSLDGDTIFAFTTHEKSIPLSNLGKEIGDTDGDWWKLNVDIVGQLAAQAVQESIHDACREAETIRYRVGYGGVIPSVEDY
jgi:L-aminopeptidase/D-esterase-like protein